MRRASSLAILSGIGGVLLPAMSLADLPQRAGWPIQLTGGTSGGYVLAPQEGVALADVDGQPGLEVIGSSGGELIVWRADGTVLPGFPVAVQGTAQSPPSVGDLDGDGVVEIVQIGRGLQYSDPSSVNVFAADGAVVSGWPVTYPNLIYAPAALGDVDQDGALDLLVQLGAWPPAGTFLGLTGEGQPLAGAWEHTLDSYPLAPPAVGDLDADGEIEVAYLTLGFVTVRGADGAERPGFPLAVTAGREHAGSVVMADLALGIQNRELAWCERGPEQIDFAVSLFAAGQDGQLLPGFPVELSTAAYGVGPLSVGDVTSDGALELIVPVDGEGVVVVDAGGSVIATVPTMAQISAAAEAVDLDGDGDLELIIDNNTAEADGRGYVEAYHHDGSAVADFPLRPRGTTLSNGGALGDLDADGQLELVVVSSELIDPPVAWVNVWTIPAANADPDQWAAFAFDERRANCFRCPGAAEPEAPEVDPGDPEESEGCGCVLAPADEVPSVMWALALAGLLGARRRRAHPRGR